MGDAALPASQHAPTAAQPQHPAAQPQTLASRVKLGAVRHNRTTAVARGASLSFRSTRPDATLAHNPLVRVPPSLERTARPAGPPKLPLTQTRDTHRFRTASARRPPPAAPTSVLTTSATSRSTSRRHSHVCTPTAPPTHASHATYPGSPHSRSPEREASRRERLPCATHTRPSSSPFHRRGDGLLLRPPRYPRRGALRRHRLCCYAACTSCHSSSATATPPARAATPRPPQQHQPLPQRPRPPLPPRPPPRPPRWQPAPRAWRSPSRAA